MRREVENFDDGRQTARDYDAGDRLCRVETIDATGKVVVSIEYIYDAAGVNVERVVRDAQGEVKRRILFDAKGQELGADASGPVRWKSMDGTDEGFDVKGQEKLSGT